jgi:hypothetical protein
LRETGEALPLWRGFFCFQTCSEQDQPLEVYPLRIVPSNEAQGGLVLHQALLATPSLTFYPGPFHPRRPSIDKAIALPLSYLAGKGPRSGIALF